MSSFLNIKNGRRVCREFTFIDYEKAEFNEANDDGDEVCQLNQA